MTALELGVLAIGVLCLLKAATVMARIALLRRDQLGLPQESQLNPFEMFDPRAERSSTPEIASLAGVAARFMLAFLASLLIVAVLSSFDL